MRIRSIKPEFWRSQTIASLPWAARLVFIGLWSYVDDNGVGLDNFKLIAADLFGLDEDTREGRDNTRDSLASVADAGLIIRYAVAGKRYLRVTNWDEHQRIDRPGKNRYPLPDVEGAIILDPSHAAEIDCGKREMEADSRECRESVARVQRLEKGRRGEGEQGRRGEEQTLPLADSADTADIPTGDPPPAGAAGAARNPGPEPRTAQEIVGWWIDSCSHRPPKRVIGQMSKEVKILVDEGIEPRFIRAGIAEWATKDLSPALLASIVNTVMNRQQRTTSPHATPASSAPDVIPDDERCPDPDHRDQRAKTCRHCAALKKAGMLL